MAEEQDKIHLTPKALEALSIELWGAEKWRAQVQEALGISYSQLHRYMTVYKGQRIPQVVALAMTALATLKRSEIEMPKLPEFKPEDLTAVKFVWEAKPKPIRVINDAKEEDIFGLNDDDEKEEKPEEQAAPPAPETPAPEPEKPAAKPSRKRAMSPEASPDRKRTGPAKAGPEKVTAPAKKPAAKKAATPKATPAKAVKKPAK